MQKPDPQAIFQDRLTRVHRRVLARVGWFGLARLVGVGGSMILWTLWMLGMADRPDHFLTYGLLLSLGAALAALAWNHLLGRLWRLRTPRQLVHLLERRGYFANLLIAAEEAVRDPSRWDVHQPVSRELRTRLLKRAADRLLHLGPADAVPINRQGLTALGVAACLLLAAGSLTVPGDTLEKGWQRFWNPQLLWAPAPTGGLMAETGPGFVVAGGHLEVAAVDATLDPGSAICEIKIGSGMWQEMPSRSVALPLEKPTLTPPYRRWVSELEDIREDFSWRFRRGPMVTAERRVEVRNYPLISELAGQVLPPPYTRLPQRDMPRLPTWLEVPIGARLSLAGSTNHPAASIHLVTAEGDSIALEQDGTAFAGGWEVRENRTFHLVVRDAYGLQNQAPLRYEVVAVPDDDPAVNLAMSGDAGLLPVDGRIELELEAADDYGLAALDLELRVLAGEDIHLGLEEGPDFQGRSLWSAGRLGADSDGTVAWNTPWGRAELKTAVLEGLETTEPQPLQMGLALGAGFAGLDLMPGDVLEVRAVARDNRRPAPAGVSRSGVLRLSLPSAAEVLAAQADSSQQRRSELEEMRRRGRMLGADLDRLTRELLKNPVPDWARQQEMEAAIQRQKKMQQELSRVARELQQDLDRLASGQMTSERMLEKAEQVGELLEQPSSASLAEMLERMNESEGKLNPDELAEAMRDVARDQKDMARRLDAALSMLQNMDREQELEGIASLLEKMIRKQQELADLSRELAEARRQEAAGNENPDENSAENNGRNEASEGGENQDGEQQDGENQEGDASSGEQSGSEEQNGEQQEGQESSSGESAETPDAEELARRQEALAEEMEQLREKLEQALAELQEQNQDGESQDPGNQEMQQALEQALEQMEQSQSQQKMDQAGEELSQMSPEMAAQLQQQALRDLGSLYSVILKTQSAMQAAMDNHQTTSLRRLAGDMLSLSARQEEIAARIPARIREVRSQELTRGQHRVQMAAIGIRDRLSELSGDDPNRIMRLLEDLDEIIETMGQGLNSLQENRANTARSAAGGSLSQANRLVISLLTEAQMSSQSGGGGSQQQQQMSLSEQLKAMAKDQAELNAMTEQMRQMLANRGMSQEMRSQMKRLGESQGDLAGRMRELDDELRDQPEGERLLGDLGALGEMMESLGQEVESGLVSEETLIRQERILSRMLDARNSVRQRDYSTRREGRTAQRLYDPESGRLGVDGPGRTVDPFDLRYQPLEKAPQEYRRLVRKYFQALQELQRRLPDREVP